MFLVMRVIRENFNQCLFIGFVLWAILISPIIHATPQIQTVFMLYGLIPLMNGLLCFGCVKLWYYFVKKLPVGRGSFQMPIHLIEMIAFCAGFLCIFAVFDWFAFLLGVFIAFLTVLKIQTFIRQMRVFLPPHHYITRRELFVFIGFFIDLIIFFTLVNLTFRIIDNPVIMVSEDILNGTPLPALRSDNLFNALYFTVITLTTVGFGDFIPLSYFGKMIVVLECLTSYVMFGLMIGLVARGIRPMRTPFSPIRVRYRQKQLIKREKRKI